MGLANRIVAKFTTKIWRTFGDKNFGLPIGAEILRGQKISLFQNSKKIILVLGGSQGARKLCEVVCEIATDFDANFLVQTGGDFVARKLPNLKTFDFVALQKMGDFLASADFVISRAGATAIAEIAAFEKSLILVPLRGHQFWNAKFARAKNAAKILKNENLTAKNLRAKILEILVDENLQKKMGANLRRNFFQKNAAEKIAAEVLKFIKNEARI